MSERRDIRSRRRIGYITAAMELIELRHADCCGRQIEELILDGVRSDDGMYVGTARQWGMAPSTLRRWIDMLGIEKEVAEIRELKGRSTRGIVPRDLRRGWHGVERD